MYKVNSMMAFPMGRRRRELDFRAPEDRLPLDDHEAPMMRSPAVNRLIDAFFAADQHADDDARTTALQGLIDANRADHAAAGVPVYAHPPLPEDFAKQLTRPIVGLPAEHREKVVQDLVARIDPGSKALVVRQLGAQPNETPFREVSSRTPDPDSEEARRRADELDKRDPLAALAHPFA